MFTPDNIINAYTEMSNSTLRASQALADSLDYFNQFTGDWDTLTKDIRAFSSSLAQETADRFALYEKQVGWALGALSEQMAFVQRVCSPVARIHPTSADIAQVIDKMNHDIGHQHNVSIQLFANNNQHMQELAVTTTDLVKRSEVARDAADDTALSIEVMSIINWSPHALTVPSSSTIASPAVVRLSALSQTKSPP